MLLTVSESRYNTKAIFKKCPNENAKEEYRRMLRPKRLPKYSYALTFTECRKKGTTTVPATASTTTNISPGTIKDQSPAYADPGYAINVTLVIIVASSDNPMAHPGMERFATK